MAENSKNTAPNPPRREKNRYFWPFIATIPRNISNLVKLNLLFVCFSLLIVTVGPCITAMCKVLWDLCEGQKGSLADRFWTAFVEGLRRSLALGAIFAAGIFLAVYALRFYWQGFSGEAGWMLVPLLMVAVLTLVWVCLGMNLFLLIGVTDLPLAGLLRELLRKLRRDPAGNLSGLAFLSLWYLLLRWKPVWGLLFCLVAGISLLWFVFLGMSRPYLLTRLFADHKESPAGSTNNGEAATGTQKVPEEHKWE